MRTESISPKELHEKGFKLIDSSIPHRPVYEDDRGCRWIYNLHGQTLIEYDLNKK